MYDVVIFQSPYTYTNEPSLAPALLKSCIEQDGYTAYAWDYSGEFNYKYSKHEYFNNVTLWMQAPQTKLTIEQWNWYNNLIIECVERIISLGCKYCAISLLSYASQRFTEDLCLQLKLRAPHIKIILGGGGTSIFQYQFQKKWHDLMLESKLADTVLIGEGEYAFGRIIKEDLRGLVTEQLLPNLKFEQIPFPNYDDYDFSIYDSTGLYGSKHGELSKLILNITSSKGCVKSCTFCDVARIWSKFRFRSGSRVAEEIIYLHKKYGVEAFSFTDSLINGGMRPFYEMNEILAERLPRQIKYYGQFIFRGRKDMPEKYFESMSRAGCDIVNIGLESGSEAVRNHMGKGSSDDDVAYSAEMLYKYGMRQVWNIIVGYPTETEEDFQKTLDLVSYWVPHSNKTIKISPVGTFLMLDSTPIMDREYQEQLQIKQNIISGYKSFAWESPNNTFEMRVDRYFRLCDLLIKLDSDRTSEIEKKKFRVQQQIDLYNETKLQTAA